MSATPFTLVPFHTDAHPAVQNMGVDEAVRYAELGFSVPAHLLVQALEVARDESYDEGHRAGYDEGQRDERVYTQEEIRELEEEHRKALIVAADEGAADERSRLAARTAAAFDTLRSLLNTQRNAEGLKALRMIEDALNP